MGLSAPILSLGLWVLTLGLANGKSWHILDGPVRTLVQLGFWTPAIGMLIGFAGRPRFLFTIIPVSIAMMLFWIGSTMPLDALR